MLRVREKNHTVYASDRANLCAALWELTGASESAYIVDWFYNEAPYAW